MSEIHRYTSQLVYLDIYGGVADALPTALFVAPNGTTTPLSVVQDTPPTGIDDRYHVVLTMANTQNEGDVSVQWTFSIDSVQVEKSDEFSIVTPYLTIAEVKKVWPEASDEEAIEVEAAVRHVINAHCGQSFGFAKNKTIVVEGHGETALRLPQRLITLTGLSTRSAVLNPNVAIIVSDGWYLKKGWSDVVSPITDTSLYWTGWDFNNNAAPGEPGYEKPSHGPVTVAPGTSSTPTAWKDDYPFTVTGDWGYERVPTPVKEAARLLVNDYACGEIAYRDRFLESIKAADWRLQFHSDAWSATGNVRADQLLAEYVIADWAVI